MRVELALPGDLAAVAAVHLATRRSAYASLLPASVLKGMTAGGLQRWWEQRLANAPPPHRLLVGLGGGPGQEVLGFAHIGPSDRGHVDGIGELHAIHVHPQAQGLGLGARLLSAALDALRDLNYLRARLWVLEGNRNAQGFYRHHGWHQVNDLRRQEDLGGALVAEVAYERDL